jgi:hypothetical protein
VHRLRALHQELAGPIPAAATQQLARSDDPRGPLGEGR